MNKWSRATIKLATEDDYLDQLQRIYSHEEGERTPIPDEVLETIREAFEEENDKELLNALLNLETFPYKDSYTAFLRKDRTSIDRNPETVERIVARLNQMGIDNVIEGISRNKEANQRRGPQFRAWLKSAFKFVDLDTFKASKRGIIFLDANEKDSMDFCNLKLNAAVTKRPDVVAKVKETYVVGEAKFLSSTGGNQRQGFDDGMRLVSRATVRAAKIFVLDGVLWIEKGSSEHKEIVHSDSSIFSVILLNKYLKSLR